MKTIFGVSSATPINKKLKNGYTMYDWVKRAFGAKWASRVAWNYWINFPLWIASLAVAVTAVNVPP